MKFQEATSGIYADIWKLFNPEIGYITHPREATDKVMLKTLLFLF